MASLKPFSSVSSSILCCLLCLALLGGISAQIDLLDAKCFKEDNRCRSCQEKDQTVCQECPYNVMEVKTVENLNQTTCTDKPNTIKNCMKELLYNGANVCKECDFGYYKKDNKCVKGTIEHCLIYSNDGDCSTCDNDRYANEKSKKCEPVPKEFLIADCRAHDYMVHTVNNEEVKKSECLVCKPGFNFDSSHKKCFKECTPGCLFCENSKCMGCDHSLMYFPAKSKCHQIKIPDGNYNSFQANLKEAEQGSILKIAVTFFCLLVLGFL